MLTTPWLMYTRTHSIRSYVHKIQTAKVGTGREGAFKDPPPPEELLVVDGGWGKEIRSSLKVWPLVNYPCPSGQPHIHMHGPS